MIESVQCLDDAQLVCIAATGQRFSTRPYSTLLCVSLRTLGWNLWRAEYSFNHVDTAASDDTCMYTLNHKKRDILFLTITLANLNRFLWFSYRINREEILHLTVVKICHITQFMCTPYLEKLKHTFCRDSWNVAVYIWLQLCQILTDFNNFCSDETREMYKTGHTFTYLLLKRKCC